MIGLWINQSVAAMVNKNIFLIIFILFGMSVKAECSSECSALIQNNISNKIHIDSLKCLRIMHSHEVKVWQANVIKGEDQTTFLINKSSLGVKISEPLLGEVKYVKSEKIIWFFGVSSHFEVRKSFIFDLSLNILSTHSHGEMRDFGVSNDEKLVWYTIGLMKNGKPIIEHVISKANGKIIQRTEHEKETNMKFKYAGKVYEFVIPEPMLPG